MTDAPKPQWPPPIQPRVMTPEELQKHIQNDIDVFNATAAKSTQEKP